MTGIPEKGLLRSHNIGQVDLIWPRTGVAKKSGAREMVFKRGVSGWAGEEAAERRFERADTAYSPRFREEKPSAAADELRLGGAAAQRKFPGRVDISDGKV